VHRASLWTRGGRGVVLARTGRLEFDRILFFSDAVFAIAVTLLIVDLPGHLGELHTGGFDSARALRASGASQFAGVVFYAACTGAAGLVETLMWAYACSARAGLVTDISRAAQRLILLRTARTPVVFVVSIAIAFISPSGAAYFWAAIVVVGAAIERFYGHSDPAALPALPAIPDAPK
jgi:hypothetical protein